MTTELFYLTLTTILAASLWIPYIVGVNKHRTETAGAFQRPMSDADLPDWVARANRAHINLIEQGLPFAVLIFILAAVDGFTPLTAWAATIFFWLRVAHAVGMITGLAQFPARPIIFTAAWICILALGYAALTA